MQTPTLSATVRSYMRDPEAFAARMKTRAEELWLDGYTVEPADTGELGVFAVNTPDGNRYLLNLLTEDCTCAYQQKHEIPQVPCKHLQGATQLIEEQIAFYASLGNAAQSQGRTERAWKLYFHPRNHLLTAWNATKDAAQCREYEELEDGIEFMEDCWTEDEIRRDMDARNFVDLKD